MPSMKMGPDGLAIVKAFESCMKAVKGQPGHFAAYVDPVGVLTIGWGHTNDHLPKFTSGTVWTQGQCDQALAGDMATFEAHVNKLAKVPLEQHEFDALVSWAFNTGGPSTASIWSALNSGKKSQIPGKLAEWNKGTVNGKKVVLNGLTRRRSAEGLLFQGRIAEAYAVAQTKPAAVSKADVAKATVAVAVGGGVATGVKQAAEQGISALEILAWIGGLSALAIVAIIIGYRIIKGTWPWTSISTGKASPELLLPSLPSLAPSSALDSAQLALSSAALLEMPSPLHSTSSPPPKPSAKRSPRTRTPRASSSRSKPTAAKKSSPKRKSKSKS